MNFFISLSTASELDDEVPVGAGAWDSGVVGLDEALLGFEGGFGGVVFCCQNQPMVSAKEDTVRNWPCACCGGGNWTKDGCFYFAPFALGVEERGGAWGLGVWVESRDRPDPYLRWARASTEKNVRHRHKSFTQSLYKSRRSLFSSCRERNQEAIEKKDVLQKIEGSNDEELIFCA